MIIDITNEIVGIEIGAEGINEIIQNIRTILATVKGTVPLDRSFGVDIGFLDEPIPLSRALYTSEVVRAIKEHEPRVEVVKILWDQESADLMDGKQKPTVRIKIIEGVDI